MKCIIIHQIINESEMESRLDEHMTYLFVDFVCKIGQKLKFNIKYLIILKVVDIRCSNFSIKQAISNKSIILKV